MTRTKRTVAKPEPPAKPPKIPATDSGGLNGAVNGPQINPKAVPLPYKSHPGEPHNMSLPITELGGGKTCRDCGRLEADIKREVKNQKRAEKREKENGEAQAD